MSALTITCQVKEDETLYELSGIINEKTPFETITPTTQNVVLDFENVKAINSYGVKRWVQVLALLKGKTITYRNCPTIIVEQMNVITLLIKGISLDSFYLPFGCDSCDLEVDKKVDKAQFSTESFLENLNELFECSSCKSYLEFLDDEDIYFKFLDHMGHMGK